MSQDNSNPLSLALRVVFGPLVEKTSQLPPPLAYGGAIVIALVVMLVLGVVIPSNIIWPFVIIVLACLAAFVYIDRDERHQRSAQELIIQDLKSEKERQKREQDLADAMGTGFVSVHVYQTGDKSKEIVGAQVKIDLPDPQVERTKENGSAIFISIPQKFMGKRYDIIVEHPDFISKTGPQQLLASDQAIDISMDPRQENKTLASTWKVKVFNFKNYSQKMEQDHIGERFSGFILNALINLNLKANQIEGEPYYLPTRSGEPELDWGEYSDHIPFVAIIGSVWSGYDRDFQNEDFHATIRVASITSKSGGDTKMAEELVCSNQPEKMKNTAHEIAEKIRDVVLKITSTSSEENSLEKS